MALARILLPLFLLLTIAPGTLRADDCPPEGQTPSRAQREACLIECEAFYQENPDARPASTARTCETLRESLAHRLNLKDNTELAVACGKGVWEGILSIPEQMRAYGALIENVAGHFREHIREHQAFIARCKSDPACRREVARKIATYRQRNPDGSFTMTDEQVDRETQGMDIVSLLMSAQHSQSSLQRSCSFQLSLINQQVGPRAGETWTHERLVRRFEAIGRWDPDCIAALKMTRPVPDTAKNDRGPTWLESLGIKWNCYPPEKINELVCNEVASFILDPLAIGTAAVGGGLWLKTMLAAGMKRGGREALRTGATQTVQRTSQDTALATPTSSRVAREEAAVATGTDSGSELARALPERRTGEPVPPATRDAPRTPTREAFIQRHVAQEFTTETQNLEWMKLARGTKPDGKTFYFDVENSKMKLLNDTTKDKNLVTAMTNRHKEITFAKLEKLKREFPDLKVIPYSDFKSVRIAFQGEIPPNLRTRLNELFQEANKEFQEELVRTKLVRAEDLSENWFRAGFGETADQATMAARYSRSAAGPNSLRSFNDPDFQGNMRDQLRAVEMFRRDVQNEIGTTGLLEKVGDTDRMIPRREVMEIARKERDPARFREAVAARFGTRLTETQARRVQDYLELVDDFSPGIHISRREIASLDGAVDGGISADFAGMGAYNMQETARALARSDTLQTALETTREGERRVTALFQDRMRERRGIITNYLQDKKGLDIDIRCSGDDCVVAARGAMTPPMREDLIQRLSRTEDPSGMRVAFVGRQVASDTDRNLLAAHGEAIEKALRKKVEGKVPMNQLQLVTFGVEMNGTRAATGGVRLLIGNSRTRLSPEQVKSINEAFAQAVRDLNQEILQKTGQPSSYAP